MPVSGRTCATADENGASLIVFKTIYPSRTGGFADLVVAVAPYDVKLLEIL